jgi:hypothetical protein
LNQLAASAIFFARVAAALAVACAQRRAQRAVALGAPHDAVDVVGARVILHQFQQEVAVVAVVHAHAGRGAAVEIHLLELLDAGEIVAPDVLGPEDGAHAALAGLGQDLGDDVEVAVVGQRLAGHLASGDAAPVSERGQKESIDRRPLLENVEHLVGAFIDERDGSDLDADRLGRHRGTAGSQARGCRAGHQKVSSVLHGLSKSLESVGISVPAAHVVKLVASVRDRSRRPRISSTRMRPLASWA